jgi:FkbM family methyltransferase
MQSIKLGQYIVWYENTAEFNELRREIWSHHVYYREKIEDVERVIDMGAHIGLATLYFAQLYPKAHLTAYEPDPANFALLTKNVAENGINATCVNAAIAPKAGTVTLQSPIYLDEWRSGVGVIPKGWRGVLHTKEMIVPALAINDVVSGPLDLVKMDIEGMEYEVVTQADWSGVKHLILEVHPRSGKRMGEIEKYLIDQGFSLEKRADEDKYGAGLWTITADRV